MDLSFMEELRKELEDMAIRCYEKMHKKKKITMKQADKSAHKEQEDLEYTQMCVLWFLKML